MMFQLEYASARVRVMRSKLLSLDAVEMVGSSSNMSELLSVLSGTMYEPFFDSIPESVSEIRGLVVSCEDKIMSFLPKDMKDDFCRILLRHEIDNVKTVVRGIYAGFCKEEILADLYPRGIIFDKITVSFPSGSDEAIALFKEIPLLGKKLLLDYRSNSIVDIERQVERTYFQMLRRIENPLFRDYVNYTVMLVDRSVSARGIIYRDDVSLDVFLSGLGNGVLDESDRGSDAMIKRAKKYVLKDSFGIGLYLNFMIRLERDVDLICASVERLSE